MGKTSDAIVPAERIQRLVLLLRGEKVIIDADLAALYGVTTRRLNEQVRRDRERFPGDFMFRLSKEEKAKVVANCDHLRSLKYSPTHPFAFTEHGALMAASVLNTPHAVVVSVHVVRAFIRLREMLAAHREIAERFAEPESRLSTHDRQIHAILSTIR